MANDNKTKEENAVDNLRNENKDLRALTYKFLVEKKIEFYCRFVNITFVNYLKICQNLLKIKKV